MEKRGHANKICFSCEGTLRHFCFSFPQGSFCKLAVGKRCHTDKIHFSGGATLRHFGFFSRKARFSRVYLWRKSEATRTKYTSLVEVHFVTLVPFFRKGRFARVDLLWKSEAMLTKYASPVKAHWNPHHQTTDEKLFKYQLLLHQPVATRWQPLATRGNPWQGVATLAFMATTHGNPLQPLANRGNPLAIHGNLSIEGRALNGQKN